MNRIMHKLQQDRLDLIEIIDLTRNRARESSYEDHEISENLSAHMVRLSELEGELMERRERANLHGAA